MPTRPIHSRIEDLPRETILDGTVQRTAVRTDHSLLSFNWLEPREDLPPPHDHPFDQLVLVMRGELEAVVGDATFQLAGGEVLQIPAGAPHTARASGNGPALVVDLFAPVRADLLHLVAHQADAFDTPA